MNARELVGEGRTAQIFAWDQGRVVKLFRSFMGAGAAQHEMSVTVIAERAGAPTPSLHGTVEIDGRAGIIYDRLAGPLMGERLFIDDPFELIAQLGALHASIHACAAPELGPYAGRVRRSFPALGDRIAGAVEARLDQLGGGDTLLHGDLHPFNVMRDDRGWVAIDWDSAMRGDPMADVARTLFLLVDSPMPEEVADTQLGRLRPELADVYLEAYASRGALDRDRLEGWRLPTLAARTLEDIPEEGDSIHRLIEQLVG